MTNEERDLISKFIGRVGGAGTGGGGLGSAFSGSVPQTQPALPPIDRDADGLISQLFQQYPDARYRITQTAVVQEAALAEAQNRIQRLQWELEQTRQAAAQAAPQQKGFFASMFGGGQGAQQRPMGAPGQQGYGQQGYGQGFQPTSAPPQPQYPPNYQPGMFQRGGGSGFLGSALTTAAGVAGGMVVGNALMGAFGGHHGDASSSPWGSNASGGDPAGFGGAGVVPTDPSGGYGSQAGFNDPFGGAGTDQGAGGFDTQTASDNGGGFDGGGGGFDGGGGGFDGGGFDNNS